MAFAAPIAALALGVGAGATVYSAVQQRKSRKAAEAEINRQQADVRRVKSETIAAEGKAKGEAEKKRLRRVSSLGQKGRTSTFRTSPFGIVEEPLTGGKQLFGQ